MRSVRWLMRSSHSGIAPTISSAKQTALSYGLTTRNAWVAMPSAAPYKMRLLVRLGMVTGSQIRNRPPNSTVPERMTYFSR